MKKEFIDYLKAIGITHVIIKRIDTIYNFYKGVCDEEIADIFVTDIFNVDGGREYENIWFFSQSYMMEAKQFTSEDDFDMTPMREQINYWSVKMKDYNFQKATDKSRLYIEVSIDHGLSGDFKAAKENCDYLKDIFQKYVLINIKS
jgi:hypothetical protein